MKNLLKLEALGLFMLSIILFHQFTDYAWWVFPLLILLPDISMLGYLANPKTGSILYNLFHHKLAAILIFTLGLLIKNEGLILTGIILFGHSSMDRIFGYGLKYDDDFKHTHLGWIGVNKG